MLNGLDLFSGIGAMSIGLSGFVKTVAYCEKNANARKALRANMHKGLIDEAPIIEDVKLVNKKTIGNTRIDIVYGGFPCQDVSNIGKKAGLRGDRSGLVYEVFRIAEEFKPGFIFLENTVGILNNGLAEILQQLALRGYNAQWNVVSAAMFGAPQERRRWFLLATKARCHIGPSPQLQRISKGTTGYIETSNKTQELGNSKGKQSREIVRPDGTHCKGPSHTGGILSWKSKNWYDREPSMDRMVNGSSNWTVRYGLLGNSVVPQCVRLSFLWLLCGHS